MSNVWMFPLAADSCICFCGVFLLNLVLYLKLQLLPQIPTKKHLQMEDRTSKSAAAATEGHGKLPTKKLVPTRIT